MECLIKSCEIRKSGYTENDNGVFALSGIEQGEVLLDERPLFATAFFSSSAPSPHFYCHQCFRWLTSLKELFQELILDPSMSLPEPLPMLNRFKEGVFELPQPPLAPSCCAASSPSHFYCSPECREKASSFHTLFQCKSFIDGSKREALELLLAPLSKARRAYLTLALRIACSEKEQKRLDDFQQTSWIELHRSSAAKAYDGEDRFSAEEAERLVRDVSELLPTGSEFVTLERLDRLLGLLQFNATQVVLRSPLLDYVHALPLHAKAHEIDAISPVLQELKKATGGLPRIDLLAVFPWHHFFNHSCLPNCSAGDAKRRGKSMSGISNRLFQGPRISIQTEREIDPGEELTIAYLGPATEKTEREEIRLDLLRSYGFKCSCNQCK